MGCDRDSGKSNSLWVKGVFSSGKTEVSDPTVTLRKLTDTYLKDYLEIKPVENTHLVKILFSTPDPNLSAQVANAHARALYRTRSSVSCPGQRRGASAFSKKTLCN